MAQDSKIRWIKLTANGVVTLGTKIRYRGEVLVIPTGSFGGGTIEFGCIDEAGTFHGFGASYKAGGAKTLEIPAGTGMIVALELVGATSPSIDLGYVGDAFEPAG